MSRHNSSNHGYPKENPRHHEGGRGDEKLIKDYKLESFYTDSGSILPKVYIETSEGIAEQFYDAQISRTSIRRFFEVVRTNYEKYQRDPNQPYEKIMEGIYRLRSAAHYSQIRKVTKQCFTDFMYHYIELASKDPKNLRGFKELFMCVICYLKSKN